ncbi:MAG: amidohydrolase/deacetylase family metallohydrolase [Balneolaceae bacterium]
MNKILFLFYSLFLCLFMGAFQFAGSAYAQTSDSVLFSLIIKNGHVIDPANDIDGVMDIAINDGKIALVAENIDARATQVVDAEGMVVTPGLIDIYWTLGDMPPDGFTFKVGVTTVANGSGVDWRSFPDYKRNLIDRSQTRVFTFLGLNGDGYQGGAGEINTGDVEAQMSARMARMYPDDIVGFQTTGQNFDAVNRAVEAGNQADLPVLTDGGRKHPQNSLAELFTTHLRPGDIYTHTYTILEDFNARETIVDIQTEELRPHILEAQERGIVFDVGHGSAFRYSLAIPAMNSGFYPNTISTNLSRGSMNAFAKDMLNVMSKFLAMGMELPDVIEASTWSPAKAIRHEELGHLSPGAVADVAILSVREGEFGYFETAGYRMDGDRKLECEMTIRGGRIVWDLNGIADPLNNYYRDGSQFRGHRF